MRTSTPTIPPTIRSQKTDAYLQGIVDTGAGIVYRLGESIETKGTRYHINPPRDLDAFARVCVNIVRHCNEGWARVFLDRCRDRRLPLDFFTFHCYGGDIVQKVRLARRLLDEYGFENTEIHLNEFRYMTNWQGIRPRDPEKHVGVPAAFEQSTGAAGAAHAVSTLVRLQDEPVAMTNYYSGDTSPWNMFGQFGIRRPVYHAYRAFNEVAKRPRRAALIASANAGHAG